MGAFGPESFGMSILYGPTCPTTAISAHLTKLQNLFMMNGNHAQHTVHVSEVDSSWKLEWPSLLPLNTITSTAKHMLLVQHYMLRMPKSFSLAHQ